MGGDQDRLRVCPVDPVGVGRFCGEEYLFCSRFSRFEEGGRRDTVFFIREVNAGKWSHGTHSLISHMEM